MPNWPLRLATKQPSKCAEKREGSSIRGPTRTVRVFGATTIPLSTSIAESQVETTAGRLSVSALSAPAIPFASETLLKTVGTPRDVDGSTN